MKTRWVPVAAGAGLGLVFAARQIAEQRAHMLAHHGWVCGTDWPGFVLLDVLLGIALACGIARLTAATGSGR